MTKNHTKRSRAKAASTRTAKRNWLVGARARIKHALVNSRRRFRGFMARRPHRSFRLSRRRDYVRRLTLPSYTGFTWYVYRTLRTRRRIFMYLVVMYSLAIVFLGGVTSQTTYDTITGLLQDSSGDLFAGGAGKLKEAGLLLVSSFLTGPDTLTPDQQAYLGLVLLLVWLSTVWLLREYLIGRSPKLRDGLYNAAAPLVSTLIVGMAILIQLLPAGIVALSYGALTGAGVIGDGFGSMLFWVFATVVGTLTLYWITSSLLALVIVTLPGMYPLRALKVAGDLVLGRRLRILYRLLWGLGTVALLWMIVLVPLILIDIALKNTWPQLEGLPLLPIGAAVVSAGSTVWYASYVYLLYRRIVDDDAQPA